MVVCVVYAYNLTVDDWPAELVIIASNENNTLGSATVE